MPTRRTRRDRARAGTAGTGTMRPALYARIPKTMVFEGAADLRREGITARNFAVLVALLARAQSRDGKHDRRTVHFRSRYEIIGHLDWPHDGASYRDLEAALDMWADILKISDTAGRGLMIVFRRIFFDDTRVGRGRFCRARPDEVRQLRSLTDVLLYLILDSFHGELRWTVQSFADRLALSRRKPSQVRATLENAVADIAAATHDAELGDYRIVFDRKGRLAHIRRVRDEDVRSWEAVTRFGQWEDVVRWAEQNP